MTEITIGIDISKDHLDVHRLPDGERRRFDNTMAGHKTLIRWIGAVPARVVYEPTGPYHRRMEVQLAAAGMPIVKVNPRQARRFAQAIGQLAKTDRLDAAMLARMGALLGLEPRPVRSAILNDLKDLHMAREALVKDRTAAKNRAKSISLALIRRHNTARLKQIEEQLAAIDAAVADLIASDPDLSARLTIPISIPASQPSPPPCSSPKCQNSAASAKSRPQPSPALLPSPASQEHGRASPSSRADASRSVRPSLCPPSSPCASTPISSPGTTSSSSPGKQLNRPSPPSCAK